MDWLEISTAVDREAVESVSQLFSEHGHGGVAIEEAIIPSPDGELYAVDATLPVKITTYLPLEPDWERRLARLEEAVWHLGQLRPVAPLSHRRVQEEDWAHTWKQYYQVHRIGARTVVRPLWRDYDAQSGEVVVSLDPGMAFGTGLHPTTSTCLILLEQVVQPSMHVLDLGTGSGILAIAAAKLGAAPVLAVDIDAVAVEAARANVRHNGLQAMVRVEQGSVALARQCGADGYDLIAANLVAKLLIDMAPDLASLLRPGARLVASGILAERCGAVEDALVGAGLEIARREWQDDWAALLAERPRGAAT